MVFYSVIPLSKIFHQFS